MKHPRPLSEMIPVAEGIVEELRPLTVRIDIAGSIRRKQPECSDIEIVCRPLLRERRDGLFDTAWVNILDEYVEQRLATGAWQHRLDKNGRPACGERYKRLIAYDTALDLFSVLLPAQYGVIFAIRTGPAEFSQRLVTPKAQGGLLPDECKVQDGALWKRGTMWGSPQESDFFAQIGLPYLEPELRGAS